MATLQDIDPRFKHLGKKVFLFSLLGLIIIFVSIYFLGKQKDLFSPKIHLYFVTNSAFGYSEGMAVKLAGFRIGKVTKITLDEQAKVRIDLVIQKKYQKWIREDSTASLKKEGYIGEDFIEISFGSLDKPELKNDMEIKFQKAKGIEDIAKEIVEELKPVALDVKNFVMYITDPKGDVTRILKNTATLTSELTNTAVLVQDLIKDTKPVIKNVEEITKNVKKETEEIPKLTSEVNKSLENVKNLTENLKKDIPNLIENTNKTINNLNKITGDIAKEVPKTGSIIDNVDDITDNTKDITESIKRSWFIRRNLPAPPAPTIILPEIKRDRK